MSDQTVEGQRDALTAAGCERIFTDTASGTLDRRPELDRLLELLLPATRWWCAGSTGSGSASGI